MSATSGHARRIVASLGQQVRDDVAAEPKAAISEHFGIEVISMDDSLKSRGDGGECDGMSFLDDNLMYYKPTASDRENFTLTHELAHFLVERDDAAIDWLACQPDTAKLTEQLCDAIASRLLISEEVIIAAGATPSGELVARLAETTHASAHVCAIRVASRLPCAGFVAVVDPYGHAVIYASRREDTRPYAWQGDSIPEYHILRSIAPGQPIAAESWWPFPDGSRSRYYISAFRQGDRVYAVFAEDDLWQAVAFHPPRESHEDTRPLHEMRCRCGYSGTFHGYPCSECHKPYCPKCQSCGCTNRAENSHVCTTCMLSKAKHLIDEDGICVDCR
jgi:Zn-dependent peptidase ImmA (M78 family)